MASPAAPDANPDRRTRAELRRLAAVQSDITSVIRDLETTTEELEDAVVFRFVHKNLNSALEQSEAALEKSSVPDSLRAQERAISLLRSLIEALDEDQQDDDDNFDDGGSSGGGGGGGQQPELIPGGAQLKLLRAVQSDLLQRTRAVDDGQLPKGELGLIGSEQRELSEVGQTLIDELKQSAPEPQLIEQAPERPAENDS